MDVLGRFWKFYDLLLKVISATLVSALLLVGVAQVFFRYVLQSSLFWTEELSRYLLIWSVVFGAALALDQGTHISVEMLVERFPANIRKLVSRINLLLVMVFCVIVAVEGWDLVGRSMRDQSLTLPVTMGVVYLALPIGGVLMLISAARLLFGPPVAPDSHGPEAEELIA